MSVGFFELGWKNCSWFTTIISGRTYYPCS